MDLQANIASVAGGLTNQLIGNPAIKSEVVVSKEVGYRFLPNKRFSADLAFFQNDFKHTVTTTRIPGNPAGSSMLDSGDPVEVTGLESAVTYNLRKDVKVTATHAIRVTKAKGRAGENQENADPKHLASIRTNYEINSNWETNLNYYFTSGFQDTVAATSRVNNVNAHNRVDLGVTWKIAPGKKVSFIGQNLLEPRHQEVPPNAFVSFGHAEIKRSFLIKGVLEF